MATEWQELVRRVRRVANKRASIKAKIAEAEERLIFITGFRALRPTNARQFYKQEIARLRKKLRETKYPENEKCSGQRTG